MHRLPILPAVMLATLLGSSASVFAQTKTTSPMFGNSTTSATGGGGMGGSSTGGMGGTTGGMGQSGIGQTSGGLGSTGQSGFGQTTATGIGGQARKAGSFVGANTAQQSQKNFVGNSQAGQNGTGQQGMNGMGGGGMGGGGMGGMNSFGMGAMMGRRAMQNAMNQNGNGAQANVQIRTTMTLSIDRPTVDTQVVSSAIAGHLTAMPALHWQGPAQVELQGRTAILRGVVATAHDRDLAERVVRLEATVDRVQNQLVVAGPASPK